VSFGMSLGRQKNKFKNAKPKFCVWVKKKKGIVCKKICLQKSCFGNEEASFSKRDLAKIAW
jgi:hypothetical protein